MSKPKQIKHYCSVCKQTHAFTENQFPFWKKKVVDGCTVYYCNRGIDCAGCGFIHKKNGITKGKPGEHGETLWYCNRWFKTSGNGEIKWENWSPQEILSGVHLGFERDPEYGVDTEDHHVVQGNQVQAMEQTLEELEELEELD